LREDEHLNDNFCLRFNKASKELLISSKGKKLKCDKYEKRMEMSIM
jgi:hypothetical protein